MIFEGEDTNGHAREREKGMGRRAFSPLSRAQGRLRQRWTETAVRARRSWLGLGGGIGRRRRCGLPRLDCFCVEVEDDKAHLFPHTATLGVSQNGGNRWRGFRLGLGFRFQRGKMEREREGARGRERTASRGNRGRSYTSSEPS